MRLLESGACGVLTPPSFATADALFRNTSMFSAAGRTLFDTLLYSRQCAANYGQQPLGAPLRPPPGCCDLSPSSVGRTQFSIDCLLTNRTSRCTGLRATDTPPSIEDVFKLRKLTSSSIDLCSDGRWIIMPQ